MLAIVSAAFIAMAANQVNISTGFGEISAEFGLAISDVALLISVFVLTYGILHVPGGFVATRWGLKRAMAWGLTVEAIGVLMSATSTSFVWLIFWRGVAGAGAAVLAAVGIAAASIWFRESKHHALAVGIVVGAFSGGFALGLYTWAEITFLTGWRTSMAIGGGVCLVIAVIIAIWFRVPTGIDSLAGTRLTKQGLKEALGARNAWLYGIAFLGAYGSYFAATQLISGYGGTRGFSGDVVALAALLIGLAGVPGSVVAGLVADRIANLRALFLTGVLLEALFLALLPFAGPTLFWLLALGLGFILNFTLAIWATVPGRSRGISPENIGTVVGLMLSISAIGGVILPWAFGQLVEKSGYTAAWIFLGISTAVVSVICLFARPAANAAATSHGEQVDKPVAVSRDGV
ncbi:MFS transporter [Arthrobacter sp. Rue61a]|nr:MFS transporter [Arthrobacter sp. Rue61a]